MTEAEAIAALEAINADGADLTWEVTYSFDNSVPVGDVISHTPAPGTEIVPDAHIVILVSLGPIPAAESRWIGTQDPITAIPIAETAAARPQVAVVVFVDLNITGDRLRLHTGVPTLKWGGNSWQGVGQFGGIDAVTESLEVLAQPVKLTLSGVNTANVSALMDSQYHGSPVTIYVGLLNIDTYALIDTPEEVWAGFIDVMYIDVSNEMSVIRVDCEHRLRRQPATSRYTDEDQRSHYPTDRFFNKLHLIPGYTGRWGARDTGFRGIGAGGGTGGGGRRDRSHL